MGPRALLFPFPVAWLDGLFASAQRPLVRPISSRMLAMARDLLGETEHLVLLALVRLGGSQYGVPILDEIAERTGRTPSRAAVYIALQRLEAKGLLSSRLGEPSAERGGRAPRYFKLERPGLLALRESRKALVSMWTDIEHQLDTKRSPRQG